MLIHYLLYNYNLHKDSDRKASCKQFLFFKKHATVDVVKFSVIVEMFMENFEESLVLILCIIYIKI